METFSNPRLMFGLRSLQIGIGDANMIKAKCQSPAFDVSAELVKSF